MFDRHPLKWHFIKENNITKRKHGSNWMFSGLLDGNKKIIGNLSIENYVISLNQTSSRWIRFIKVKSTYSKQPFKGNKKCTQRCQVGMYFHLHLKKNNKGSKMNKCLARIQSNFYFQSVHSLISIKIIKQEDYIYIYNWQFPIKLISHLSRFEESMDLWPVYTTDFETQVLKPFGLCLFMCIYTSIPI